MAIADRIRKLRRERNWTQDELGKKLGISAGNVARYENGHNVPRKKMLERFATAFAVSPDFLEADQTPEDQTLPNDPEFVSLVRELWQMSDHDKTAVKHVLQLLVRQSRIQAVMAS